ncbi:MAG: hypothetical protein ACK44M_09680, partial [Chloroflexus sp.]
MLPVLVLFLWAKLGFCVYCLAGSAPAHAGNCCGRFMVIEYGRILPHQICDTQCRRHPTLSNIRLVNICYDTGITRGCKLKEQTMQYTRFGSTGMQVSRICLGCMSYGSPAW